MKTSMASIRSVDLRRVTLIAFAVGAVALLSTRAHAADPEGIDAITVSAPVVESVELDTQTAVPLEEMSASARVRFTQAALATDSGVALFRQSVLAAASKACTAAQAEDYPTCVRDTVIAAEPQVDQAISQAKRVAAGS